MEFASQASPVRYRVDCEKPEKDEDETTAKLIQTMRGISETTFKHSGHATRSVHAKSHGILRGELEVLDSLPQTLRQGLFAKAGSYPVVMRLSTVPGDILPDSVSTPRGLAVKIVGVEGDRLPGSENAITQDFVLVNGPAFQAPNAKTFLALLKPLAAMTDKAETTKKVTSAMMRGTEKLIEAFGGDSAKVKSMGGQAETHILGETFFSQVPLRYGDYIVKLAIVPVSPELKALTDAPLEINGKPNALREAVVDFFAKHGGEWEVRVQLCTDEKAMPIEDASVVWPEDQSPYLAVARITVPPQQAWSEARSAAVDDGLSFSPWHGLAAHQPLGSIMRARKMAYEMAAHFRSEHNQRRVEEPRSLDAIPA